MVANNMTEEWRPVPGYGTLYEVSNLGRVRSNRRRWRSGEPRMLRAKPTRSGYIPVTLSDGTRHEAKLLHHIVLEAFHGPRPSGAVARHLDDDRANNTAANLAWGTQADNVRDAVRNGRVPRGSNHHMTVLSEDQVVTLRIRYEDGESASVLSREYGIDKYSVYNICSGRTRTSVGGPRSCGIRNRKYSQYTMAKIVDDRSKGMTYSGLRTKYGISLAWLSQYLRRRANGSPNELPAMAW